MKQYLLERFVSFFSQSFIESSISASKHSFNMETISDTHTIADA